MWSLVRIQPGAPIPFSFAHHLRRRAYHKSCAGRLGSIAASAGSIAAGHARARAGEPAVLGAVIGFLCNHEPDLVACAADLGVKPETLAGAGDRL